MAYFAYFVGFFMLALPISAWVFNELKVKNIHRNGLSGFLTGIGVSVWIYIALFLMEVS